MIEHMSQKKKKKTEEYPEEQEPRKGRRRINWTRVLGLLAAAVILLGGVGVGIDLFSSSSAGGTESLYAKTPPSSAGTTAAATTAATASASSASAIGYVQPAGAEWNLKLVNQWNPLDSSYSVPLTTISGDNQYDSRAADKLKEMVSAGSAYDIRTASLYRSIDLQTKLFNNEVSDWVKKGESQAQAETDAAKAVARPGQSEHNLGLAADLLFGGYSSLEESMDQTDAFRWLQQHCADYGFILRFPKGKESVTGVEYEPWHYRYVGEDAAHEIMSRGITLEEYLQENGK